MSRLRHFLVARFVFVGVAAFCGVISTGGCYRASPGSSVAIQHMADVIEVFDLRSGYGVEGGGGGQPDGDGYRSESVWTICRHDGGTIDSATVDAEIVKWIRQALPSAIVDVERREARYALGNLSGTFKWTITPENSGKKLRITCLMEEQPN